MKTPSFWALVLAAFSLAPLAPAAIAATPSAPSAPTTAARLFALDDVRLLDGPFSDAVAANRKYILAHDPDRLLAPFLREAGLKPKKDTYPNWESSGLDGHTAGHYLSALSFMVAAGDDADGELGRRLDYMLSELERVQQANGDGYIGGVPGSREFWQQLASGDIGKIRGKWVPWYNVHKTFAGLRDAYLVAGRAKARALLVSLGDWSLKIIGGLDDDQMQRMLNTEYGGMNESLADIYSITGDKKYLAAADRFNHRAIIEPLLRKEDRLTGLHANTQIPKIIGLEEIAAITGNREEAGAARFFWDTVVNHRSLAFGGNSVAEHFNDPKDFSTVLEHREGPETCNTYNMLRLTEKLFAREPRAIYSDYYERALYNHILSTIDPKDPGYVYFTPIRPDHYRVYSRPEQCFWCCVGTGMESPGRYGQFIYARDKDGVFVNLFVASELKIADGFVIRQENKFPYEPRTSLRLALKKNSTFTLNIRHPAWVEQGALKIRVNGQTVLTASTPSSYAAVRREWRDGDRIDVELPMRITVEKLPDGTDWSAILYGPVLLATPAGTENLVGERGNSGRMSHVAGGPLVPLDKAPFLITTEADLAKHIVPDPSGAPLHFRVKDVVEPKSAEGLPLEPFYSLHHQRYQMYWEVVAPADVEKRRETLAAAEAAKIARETATLDRVAPGEQQSEVEHDFKGEGSKTGQVDGRRWRGESNTLEYTFDARGEKAAEIEVTYWGSERERNFDILVDGVVIGSESLNAERFRRYIQRRYTIPAELLAKASGGRVTVRFAAKSGIVARLFEIRLMKLGAPELP